MNQDIRIGPLLIGPQHPPHIIAEMSGNHNQSLERALAIVDAAAAAGAQMFKVQTYTADTMTLDVPTGDFRIEDPNSLWHGQSLYQLYQRAYTPWEWHQTIFDRCREKGIVGFSTPFDLSAVDFLESLNVPVYKVASFENTDVRLIRYVARTGKPMIISTGMATKEEIEEAVAAARDGGCKDLILLKCTSAYPARPESANLRTLQDLRDRFHCLVGLSDHTLGLDVSLSAVALGACVIERHVTLRRADGGVDSAFSLEPAELEALARSSQASWQALGKVSYGPTPQEQGSLRFRRSLYIARDMVGGESLTPETLKAVRPGFGLPTKFYERLIGKRVEKAIKKGTPMRWELLKTEDRPA